MDDLMTMREAHLRLNVAKLERYAEEHARSYEPVGFTASLFDIRGGLRMKCPFKAATSRAAAALAMAMCHRMNVMAGDTHRAMDERLVVIDGDALEDADRRIIEEEAGVFTFDEFLQKVHRVS